MKEGAGSYSVYETDYGRTLRIESDNDMVFEGTYSKGGHELWNKLNNLDYFLTMNAGRGRFIIYSESNETVNIHLSYKERFENPNCVAYSNVLLNYSLKEG